MADKSIGELVAASSVQNSDLFVLDQGGTAKKLTGQVWMNWLIQQMAGMGTIRSIEYVSSTGTNPVVDKYRINFVKADSITDENPSGTPLVFEYNVTNGVKGDTGPAWYVHLKYASKQPTSNSDMGNNPDGNSWIGIYSGTSQTPPTSYTSYSWARFKGDQGVQGISIVGLEEYDVTHTPGGYDYYKLTRSDNGTPVEALGPFAVRNGQDGEGSPGDSVPLLDSVGGTVGSATAYSRQDHQHPLQVNDNVLPSIEGIASSGSQDTYARTDHVHPAGAVVFTVTLTTSGWSNGAQNVSDSKFATSGYIYFVDPAGASRDVYNDSEIYADDVTVSGRMTFHCGSVPASAVTVKVIRMVTTTA